VAALEAELQKERHGFDAQGHISTLTALEAELVQEWLDVEGHGSTVTALEAELQKEWLEAKVIAAL